MLKQHFDVDSIHSIIFYELKAVLFLQYISAAFLYRYFDHGRCAYRSGIGSDLAQLLVLIDNLSLVRYLVL
jgi:hypothetical protein